MTEEYITKSEAKLALANEFAFHSYAGGVACKVIDNIPAHEIPYVPTAERLSWIKVTDRLPKKRGTYLIYTAKGNVTSASFSDVFQRFNGVAGGSCTHWMEMPPGPENTGEGGATISQEEIAPKEIQSRQK